MGLSFSIEGTVFLVFCVFAIAAVGYLIGRITVEGVNLGTAGVFVAALLFGCFCYPSLAGQLSVDGVSYVTDGLKIVENLGLMFFVTAVGFIAGPTFLSNFKKNFKSYVCLGLVIILFGALACVGCILIGRHFTNLADDEFTAILVGLLAGALTSTPAFSAAKATVATAELESLVSVGYGIAYLFGVVGVVLFVQLIPKLTHADMAQERAKLNQVDAAEHRQVTRKLIQVDDFGFMPLSLAILCGVVVGSIHIGNFALTTTGGCILMGLVFGHLGHLGPVNLLPKETTLKALRELGLVLFLIGAGVAGGSRFVEFFHGIYFVYGVIMTVLPMVVGYLFAKYILKLSLLNNLGSITGGRSAGPRLVYKETTMHGIPLPGDGAPSLKAPFDADTCRVLRDMMRNNVQQTYGQSMFGSLAVCAKSGTAEAAPGQSPHAWFAGFVADEDLPLAFVALVENGGGGADAAGPIAARLLAMAAG